MIDETLIGEDKRTTEEQDSLGRPTGIEREEVDPIHEPFPPEIIDVVTRNPTVDLLISRMRRGTIDLEPDFQRRRGIWTDERQSRLIESLLLKIPLPTLYAAEDSDGNWIVVDGIQRLTAIARFVEPDSIGADRLALGGLEYLGKTYSGATYNDLPGRLQTRLRETELVLHLIRSGTPEEVMFNIFARINTGGVPLSAQEVRHALIPGQARRLLKELAEGRPFKEATGGSVRDERMADREMVLRFIAFRLTDPAKYTERDFDEFLRQSMRRVNGLASADVERLKAGFASSMSAAKDILGQDAFRKRYSRGAGRHPVNKALFEAQSVNLAKLTDEERRSLVRRRGKVLSRFIRLMREDPEFDRAVSVSTGDIGRVRLRFQRIADLFAEVLDG